MNNPTLTAAEIEAIDAANVRALDEMRYEDVRIVLALVPAPDMYPAKDIFEIAW